MMTKENKKKTKERFWSDFLKGNFIYKERFTKHLGVIGMVLFFFIVIIYTNHLASKKITRIAVLKEQAEEYKSRNALAQSKLIKVKMESQLGKEMIIDSLLPLESHPHKILIKIDKKNVQPQ